MKKLSSPEQQSSTPNTKPGKKSPIADLPDGISVHKLGNGSFRVRLGKKFTRNRPLTKDFTKLKTARDWIAEQTRDCVALRQMELTPEQVANAKTAFARLGETPLLEAVDYFLNSGQASIGSTKLTTALELYLAKHTKAGSGDAYINAQKISLGVLQNTWKECRLKGSAPEKSKPSSEKETKADSSPDFDLTEFTATELDRWFSNIKKKKQWSDINTLNYVRDLKMFFRFCVRRKLLASNPMDDPVFDWVKPLRKKSKQNHEVTIYKVGEVQKILTTALQDEDSDMLPWFTIAFFSGIRVDEMRNLKWELFRWGDQMISLSRADVAKRGDPRHIKFNAAFKGWIAKVPSVKTRTGPVFSPVNWRHRLDQFHIRAGIKKKRNALRHTFASYHYVHFGDPDSTRKMLGHKTDDVLFAHYIDLVTKKDASKFWLLRPPNKG